MSFQGYSSQDSAQPLQEQEVTAATETSIYWELQWQWQRKWQASSEEDAQEATKAESIRGYIQELSPIRSNNYIWWERERENGKVSLQKTVPSGPNEEGTYNRFSCFAVHGKMALSTNT